MRLEVIEQPGLRLAVVDCVLVVVEMVLSNVRDDGRVELRPRDAVLMQGMARDLECRVFRVAGHHRVSQLASSLESGVVISDGAESTPL